MIANAGKFQDFKGPIKLQLVQNALIMPKSVDITHSVECSLYIQSARSILGEHNLMNRRNLLLGAFLALFLIAPTVLQVSAQNPTGPGAPPDHGRIPDCHRDEGNIWISTDIITIMANEEIPKFHFWYTADENGTNAKFMMSYTTMVEFEDENGDDAFQSNETLYAAPLAAYEWSVQTGSVTNDDDLVTEVWLKYTKGGVREGGMHPEAMLAEMPDMADVQRFADVTLQIWAHIYPLDYEGNVTDDQGVKASFTVAGGSELKMDISIGNFPFSSENSSMAIQTLMRENMASGPQYTHRHRIETRERVRNTTLHSDMNWNTEGGNESRFENMMGGNTQQIDFVDVETGMTQGFFSWLDTALITWPGGETEAVNVTASYMPTGAGVAVYLACPNFDNGTLLHDPSIGLIEGAAPSVGLIPTETLVLAGVGAIVLIAVVVVLIRRR